MGSLLLLNIIYIYIYIHYIYIYVYTLYIYTLYIYIIYIYTLYIYIHYIYIYILYIYIYIYTHALKMVAWWGMRTAQIYILDMAPGSADWAKELCGQSVDHIVLWFLFIFRPFKITEICSHGFLSGIFNNFSGLCVRLCLYLLQPLRRNIDHPWIRDEMEWWQADKHVMLCLWP